VSLGGRAAARDRIMRRVAWVAGALVVLTLLLVLTGHWILGVIFALLAAAAVWGFAQARAVR
jgi:hypothetical protein